MSSSNKCNDLTKLLTFFCCRLSSRDSIVSTATLVTEIPERGTIFTKSNFVYYSVTNKLHLWKIRDSWHLYFSFNPRAKLINDFSRLYVYFFTWIVAHVPLPSTFTEKNEFPKFTEIYMLRNCSTRYIKRVLVKDF